MWKCKDCLRLVRKKWDKENVDRIKEQKRVWNDQNKDHNSKMYKDWYKKNRDKSKARVKLDRLTNPQRYQGIEQRRNKKPKRRLEMALRSRLYSAIKQGHKGGSAIRDLGCSIDKLMQRLEGMFQPGMSWSNWGAKGWHIDHIVPLDAFDLTKHEDVAKACHYTNLQPLWWYDNMSKGAKVDVR